MGLFDKINGASEELGKNSDLLMAIAALMENLAEKDDCANEYCRKIQKMTKSFETEKKGALGFVQKAKGTADYMAIANEVRSEKTRVQVNEVLRNQYGVNECFMANEWQTILDLDFASRIQSKIMTHYMQTKGDAFEEATSNDKVFQAMGERISLIHMRKTNGF